jgi:hypothetical protein
MDATITSTEAARRVGLTRVNLWLRAKALGLPARAPGRPKAMPDDLFARMWQAGVSPSAISAHFGVAKVTPCQTARRLGLRRFGPAEARISLREFWAMEQIAAMARDAKAEVAARRAIERFDGREVAA